MKFEIPKIVRAMKLAEYAPEMGETEIQVWVNPPRAKLQEYWSIVDEGKVNAAGSGARMAGWLSEMWSQGPSGTEWTAEQVLELVGLDTDPRLFIWCLGRTIGMIAEHRAGQKKG